MNTKPNVILIFADDLGRGMLSCYGQKHFDTPHMDALCRHGVRFDRAYGGHMCAPSRAALICGIHDCHAGRWTFNRAGLYLDYAEGRMSLEQVYECIHNTGIEQRSGDVYLPMLFNRAGYATGQIGKLEWGFATTGDEIRAHGWGYHYGYYDHLMCHGYYPPFVFEDGVRIDIEGNTDPRCGAGPFSFHHPDYQVSHNDPTGKAVYSQDLFDQKIVDFITEHKDRPFFLYHPSQLPHNALHIPEIDARVRDNPALNPSEKEYASMALRLDRTVGLITETLERLGLTENTLVILTADNGHCLYYVQERTGHRFEHDIHGRRYDHLNVLYTSERGGDVFNGNDGMTGCKLSSYEGGTRVPLIVSWKGHIRPRHDTATLTANYDFYATMADMLNVDGGEGKDGVSYLAALDGSTAGHDYIVYASEHGPAIVTQDGWKLRVYLRDSFQTGVFGDPLEKMNDDIVYQLYYLPGDYREERNLAGQHPERVRQLRGLLLKECDGNFIHGTTRPHFAFDNP